MDTATTTPAMVSVGVQTSPKLDEEGNNIVKVEEDLDTSAVAESSSGKTLQKRKRKGDENNEMPSLAQLSEVFLRIVYPLSNCFDKNITTGVFKSLDYMPSIQLNHSGKTVSFTEEGWNGFNKSLNLVECYISNKMLGRKHAVRLPGCDIEIDIVKVRGTYCVRFKDLTKHDGKIVLNEEEFYMMTCVTPVINRYLRQLNFCGPVIRDYLINTIDNQPNATLLTSPVDTSLFNRLPQEVSMYRLMKYLPKQVTEDDFKPLTPVGESDQEQIEV